MSLPRWKKLHRCMIAQNVSIKNFKQNRKTGINLCGSKNVWKLQFYSILQHEMASTHLLVMSISMIYFDFFLCNSELSSNKNSKTIFIAIIEICVKSRNNGTYIQNWFIEHLNKFKNENFAVSIVRIIVFGFWHFYAKCLKDQFRPSVLRR